MTDSDEVPSALDSIAYFYKVVPKSKRDLYVEIEERYLPISRALLGTHSPIINTVCSEGNPNIRNGILVLDISLSDFICLLRYCYEATTCESSPSRLGSRYLFFLSVWGLNHPVRLLSLWRGAINAEIQGLQDLLLTSILQTLDKPSIDLPLFIQILESIYIEDNEEFDTTPQGARFRTLILNTARPAWRAWWWSAARSKEESSLWAYFCYRLAAERHPYSLVEVMTSLRGDTFGMWDHLEGEGSKWPSKTKMSKITAFLRQSGEEGAREDEDAEDTYKRRVMLVNVFRYLCSNWNGPPNGPEETLGEEWKRKMWWFKKVDWTMFTEVDWYPATYTKRRRSEDNLRSANRFGVSRPRGWLDPPSPKSQAFSYPIFRSMRRSSQGRITSTVVDANAAWERFKAWSHSPGTQQLAITNADNRSQEQKPAVCNSAGSSSRLLRTSNPT